MVSSLLASLSLAVWGVQKVISGALRLSSGIGHFLPACKRLVDTVYQEPRELRVISVDSSCKDYSPLHYEPHTHRASTGCELGSLKPDRIQIGRERWVEDI